MPNPKPHKSVSVNKPSYDQANWLRNKIVEDTQLSITKVVEIALSKLAKEKGYKNGKAN
jgi:hypothetical protein